MSPNSTPSEPVIAACADLARAHERDRWLAALLAPARLRRDLAVIYAFAGELARTRETVSEAMIGRIRLQWWREAVERAAAGEEAHAQPVTEALAPLLASGRVNPAALLALIDAREADLGDDGFARLDDFLAYLDATAGALNGLALDVLGETGDAAREAAQRIGRAFGVLGHLRAAAVNASQGRVMLPGDLLGGHGIGRAAMLSGDPGPAMKDAARELGFMAAGELATARALRREVPRAVLPVTALARFCDAYLNRLAKREWEIFAAGVEPAPIAAPMAVLRAALTGKY